MPESAPVKYLVKLKFEVEGVVEKADLIGAIFGQTEGLFGPELNLNELQKSWKVGRIEINLEPKGDKTRGEVLVPMSTDINTAALIAAAVEGVEKVGPCAARFELSSIDDVRAIKRKTIADRAKNILKEWASKITSESEELLKDVADSTKRAKIVSVGKDELPAGPGIRTSNEIILVEGRADVNVLLRAGVENVLAIEGAKIPESIARLTHGKKVTAFLDGDRAGDLILKELRQIVRVDRVARAPPGREVEELTPLEVQQIIEGGAVSQEAPRAEPMISVGNHGFVEKVKELYPKLNGSLEAVLLDDELRESSKLPISELVNALGKEGAKYVIFDGIITQRLVDACGKSGVKVVVGHRAGELSERPSGLSLATFRDLGIS